MTFIFSLPVLFPLAFWTVWFLFLVSCSAAYGMAVILYAWDGGEKRIDEGQILTPHLPFSLRGLRTERSQK